MDKITISQPREFESIDEAQLWRKYTQNRNAIQLYVREISEDKYRFWDKAQFTKAAEGFTKAESWFLAREIRKISSNTLPIRTPNPGHEHFTWLRLRYTDKLLRQIDMYAGGHFLVEKRGKEAESEKQKFLARGIMEEAIASSQLEGANTTRRYAKKMIAEKLKPRNKSDWMILNNYKVIQNIEEEYKNQDLSREFLLDMHTQLTENTMDEADVGRFRVDDDEVVVQYEGKIAHTPPEQDDLSIELDRLIKYANDDTIFTHPVIKATVLHFWIGFLHPFVDGNGRLARSIFYWYMLKHDYWAVVYLPISQVIKRAPKHYTYSYIYTEQDNLDFTYFYDYNIKRIIQCIDEFTEYAQRLHEENKTIDRKLGALFEANDRQKQLIHYLLSNEDHFVTVTSHKTMNKVSRQTAYRDISDLVENGLTSSKKAGRTVRYYASKKLRNAVTT